jgi:hypothetical protein
MQARKTHITGVLTAEVSLLVVKARRGKVMLETWDGQRYEIVEGKQIQIAAPCKIEAGPD